MKFLLTAVLFASFTLGVDPIAELDWVQCTHYLNPKKDPSLSVSFKREKDGENFTRVTARERFTSSYTNDTKSVTIYSHADQVADSKESFEIGIDGVTLSIKRPIPRLNQAKKPNATLDFGTGKTFEITCEQLAEK